MGRGIWIFEEHDRDGTKNITLELLTEAQKLNRRIKEPLCVCLIGEKVSDQVATLSRYGIDKMYVVEDAALFQFDLDAYSAILAKLIREFAPSLLMVGATPEGSELAPMVAAKVGIPCTTDVKKIAVKKGRFTLTKSVYEDQAYARIEPVLESPLIVTISPGETDIASAGKHDEPEIVRLDFDFSNPTPRTRTGKYIKGDPAEIKIVEADRIVAGGRGAGATGFSLLEEFAIMLEASMAGSRAAVDDGLVPVDRQIGISGNTVVPKLLVACGISGAREFTVGMENADLVIAINTDEKARIFEIANLCIKGDLNKVIPAAMRKIEAAKKTKAPVDLYIHGETQGIKGK